jgi:DNA-binding transcriptional regulator PaaX
MNDDQKRTAQLIASWAQFVAMAVGIATILMHMGRKEQQLTTTVEQVKELGSIVTELAKAQVSFSLTDKITDERLKELSSRLDRLERSSK